MNRHQRREAERLRKYLDKPLHTACADCTGHAVLTDAGDGSVTARVFHDDGCPVLAGRVEWRWPS